MSSAIPHFLCSLISLNVGEQFNNAVSGISSLNACLFQLDRWTFLEFLDEETGSSINTNLLPQKWSSSSY